jgi:hypothetical protein
MQDAVPHLGFYVIKLHDLKGSCSTVPAGQREKLWRKFFLDPSQWWDHRSEKVTQHQTCRSSHVNGTIALVALTLVALLPWSKLCRNSIQVLCSCGIVIAGWRR